METTGTSSAGTRRSAPLRSVVVQKPHATGAGIGAARSFVSQNASAPNRLPIKEENVNPLGDLPKHQFKKAAREALLRCFEFLRSIDPQVRVMHEADRSIDPYLEEEIRVLYAYYDGETIRVGKLALEPALRNIMVRSTNALLLVPDIRLVVSPICATRSHGTVMEFRYFWAFELHYTELPEIELRIIGSQAIQGARVVDLRPKRGIKGFEVEICRLDAPYTPPRNNVTHLFRSTIRPHRPHQTHTPA